MDKYLTDSEIATVEAAITTHVKKLRLPAADAARLREQVIAAALLQSHDPDGTTDAIGGSIAVARDGDRPNTLEHTHGVWSWLPLPSLLDELTTRADGGVAKLANRRSDLHIAAHVTEREQKRQLAEAFAQTKRNSEEHARNEAWRALDPDDRAHERLKIAHAAAGTKMTLDEFFSVRDLERKGDTQPPVGWMPPPPPPPAPPRPNFVKLPSAPPRPRDETSWPYSETHFVDGRMERREFDALGNPIKPAFDPAGRVTVWTSDQPEPADDGLPRSPLAGIESL